MAHTRVMSHVSPMFIAIIILCTLLVAVVIYMLSKTKDRREGLADRVSTIPAAKHILDDPGALHACIAAADVCGTRDGYFPGSISTIADLVVKGNLDAGGKSTLQNDLNVLRSLTVNGMATMGGNMQFGDSLRVGGDASSTYANVGGGGLDVKGSSTFKQNLDVENSVGIAGNATLDGNVSVGALTNVSREMQIAQALNISGAATFRQPVTAGRTNMTNALSVSKALTVTGPAIVSGKAILGRKLYVNGLLTTGAGDVTVSGDSVMKDSVIVSNALNVADVGRLDGGLQVQSRNGGWTTIGAPNGGKNAISGPTTVTEGEFCINKECVDTDKLSKIRFTEENLTQRLEDWDTVTKAELDTINKNVFDNDGLLKTHDTEEIAKYQHMLTALTNQASRLKSLSKELESIKKDIADTKKYELEQDKVLSRLEDMMKKTNDTYFESMKKIVEADKCMGGGGATPSAAYTSTNGNTPFQTMGGGHADFLDRHNIDCGGNGAINQFKLNTQEYRKDGNISYAYTCTTGPGIKDPTPTSTPRQISGHKGVHYLDRHNVQCENGSAISRMQLRSENDTFRYDYSCSKTQEFGDCYNLSTAPNLLRGFEVAHLDRHDVKCQPNEVLSRFQLVRVGDQIKYDYTCCKYKPPPPPPAAEVPETTGADDPSSLMDTIMNSLNAIPALDPSGSSGSYGSSGSSSINFRPAVVKPVVVRAAVAPAPPPKAQVDNTPPVPSVINFRSGRSQKYCSGDYNVVICNRDTPGAWEKYSVEKQPDGTVALRGGKRNMYCSDYSDGVLRCNIPSIGSWEKHQIVMNNDNTFALKGGRGGKYCTDDNDSLIRCNRDQMGPWERHGYK